MRIRPLIVAGLFEAYGLWRFVMDVLGDADILRSLTDKEAWLNAYGPILIGLALIAWAIWPRGNKKGKPMSSDKPVLNETVGLEVDHDGDGNAVEINVGNGGNGAVINAMPIPGSSVLGARITKRGGHGAALEINHFGGSGHGLEINVGPGARGLEIDFMPPTNSPPKK